MEQRQEEPQRRRRPVAGSRIGQPRTLAEMYQTPPLIGTLRRRLTRKRPGSRSGPSPAAVAIWARWCRMDPLPPAVQVWRDWEARQLRDHQAAQLRRWQAEQLARWRAWQRENEPPARAEGSRASGSGELSTHPGEQHHRGDADQDERE